MSSLNETSVSSPKNIYAELAKLPPEVADRITTAKTNGGRSLNAIWALDISSTHKLIMVYLGSKIDFTKNFVGEYESISLTEIFNQTSCSKNTVLRAINGYTEKTKEGEKRIPGLIEMGYIKKITPKKSDCIQNHLPNQYCLTSKAFDEYMIKMLEWEKIKDSDSAQKPSKWSFFHQNKNTPPTLSATTSSMVEDSPSPTMALALVPEWHQGTSHHGTSPSAMVGHYFPLPPQSSPIIPVCEEKRIGKEKKCSSFKPTHTQKKDAKDNSNYEDKLKRLQINLSLAICESLRRKFVSNDLCGEVLKIVFQKTDCSLEKMIDVIEDVKTYHFLKSDRKSDLIDTLTYWIQNREDNIQKINHEKQVYEREILEQQSNFELASKNLEEKNMKNEAKNTIEIEKIDSLPENFKSWYRKLTPISKREIKKEINQIGTENFMKIYCRQILK